MPQNNLLPSILIVDDEIPSRSELIRIIKQINSDFPIYEAESGKEAVSQLDQINCDIVFLDIQLCDQNGMQLAEKLLQRPDPPVIIMATAHDEYAMKGFELNVTDYILKPFRSKWVEKALDKAISNIQAKTSGTLEIENILRRFSNKTDNIDKLWAERENGSRLMINYSDIQWIGAKNKKVFIMLNQEELRVRATLSELSERLPNDTFIRVHKTYIININFVRELIPWDSHAMTLVMSDKEATEIPVGRGYANKLKLLVGW
ncbi:MAG: LytTR family DNA-binding domain-containing protein [Methylococcaceae bacterium]